MSHVMFTLEVVPVGTGPNSCLLQETELMLTTVSSVGLTAWALLTRHYHYVQVVFTV